MCCLQVLTASLPCVSASLFDTVYAPVQSKRGEHDGNDTESADEQTGSPLHVLSDMAQKEGELEIPPDAAVNGADSKLSPRMQTRSGGTVAPGEARSAKLHHANNLGKFLQLLVAL